MPRASSAINKSYRKLLEPYFPLFLVFLSGLGFSMQSLIVKVLSMDGYDLALFCVLSRGVFQTIVSSYLVYREWASADSPKMFGDTWFVTFILNLRSLVGFLGIAFSFLSVELLPVGDADVLTMLGPIFTAIGGYFILGEPWRIPEFIGTVTSLFGATLVAKPTFIFGNGDHSNPWSGILYGLLASISSGSAFLTIRILGTTAKMPVSNICLVQGIGQIILSLPTAYAFKQPIGIANIGLKHIIMILISGTIGCLSQFAMTIGMRKEKSALASAVRMSDIVFAYTWQVLFTNDKANVLSIIGALIVTMSIIFVVLSKQVPKTDDNNKVVEIQLNPINRVDDLRSNRLADDIIPTTNFSGKRVVKSDIDRIPPILPGGMIVRKPKTVFESAKDFFDKITFAPSPSQQRYDMLSQESQHG